jgi:hypothetical protein
MNIANDGVTPNSVIDITAGVAESDDNTTSMVLPSNYTKALLTWAVGSAGGCLDTGSVTASSWYYLFAIERIDTQVVDLLCSKSLLTPVLPNPYTKKRLVAEFATDTGTLIRRFYSHQDGHVYKWSSSTYQTSTATTARTLVALDVPPGIIVLPFCQMSASNATPPVSVLVQTPADTDIAPSSESPFLEAPGWDMYAQVLGQGGASNAACPNGLETNTSQQVATRASVAATTLNFMTRGWSQIR